MSYWFLTLGQFILFSQHWVPEPSRRLGFTRGRTRYSGEWLRAFLFYILSMLRRCLKKIGCLPPDHRISDRTTDVSPEWALGLHKGSLKKDKMLAYTLMPIFLYDTYEGLTLNVLTQESYRNTAKYDFAIQIIWAGSLRKMVTCARQAQDAFYTYHSDQPKNISVKCRWCSVWDRLSHHIALTHIEIVELWKERDSLFLVVLYRR